MNALMRGTVSPDPSSSNPAPTAETTDAQSAAESTSESVEAVQTAEPQDSGKPLGRRATKAEADKARIAVLEAQLAERDPDRLRDQIRQELTTEQAQQAVGDQQAADAALYRELADLPSDHSRLYATDRVDDDGNPLANWQWIDNQRKLIAGYPKVKAHYESTLANERAALAAERQGHEQEFAAHVWGEIQKTLGLPGIDETATAALMKAPWSEQVRIHRAAERQVVEAEHAAELARLTKENDELKRDALGAVRAPIAAGMPSGTGGVVSESEFMNNLMRSVMNGSSVPAR